MVLVNVLNNLKPLRKVEVIKFINSPKDIFLILNVESKVERFNKSHSK